MGEACETGVLGVEVSGDLVQFGIECGFMMQEYQRVFDISCMYICS
jgi:hypothetical protein